ncbi:MAG: hypothetical protein KF823_10300 [Xanthomonadales bacterium]|nr:hypothetical protein [Xanthomonadales bacterium]
MNVKKALPVLGCLLLVACAPPELPRHRVAVSQLWIAWTSCLRPRTLRRASG